MQPERQVSLALIGIGAALAVPESVAIVRHHAPPGASLAVGTVLGALGVCLRCLLAAGHLARTARLLGLAFWTLAAFLFSAAALTGAWHAATWPGRLLFGLAALKPLAGPILVFLRREEL